LKDEEPAVRSNAARALGEIGAEPGVVRALVEGMVDDSTKVRVSIGWALTDIGLGTLPGLGLESGGAISILVKALDSEDVDVRTDAAFALGEFGAEAKAAVGKLNELAQKEADDEIRWYYRDAISKIEG